MDIKVHSVHFTADKKLIQYVNEKVSKLELFFDHIVAGEVYLRLDKSSDRENKVSEVKLLVPGKELFAKKQCKSFEEAIALSVEALRKQVEKQKRHLVN
ncbi:MAG: ribosome-associated translation inhibitor RaiA [Bacteroidetes bacterium]|nr:MAG: ribosome-associated translation inhibitor RaiA [Bacteroidota bacterium]